MAFNFASNAMAMRRSPRRNRFGSPDNRRPTHASRSSSRLSPKARFRAPIGAHEWFREAGNAPLSPDQQYWRIRAALRALAWSDVRSAIDALTDHDGQDPAWRFWKARALAELGAKEEANAIYATLAPGLNFY